MESSLEGGNSKREMKRWMAKLAKGDAGPRKRTNLERIRLPSREVTKTSERAQAHLDQCRVRQSNAPERLWQGLAAGLKQHIGTQDQLFNAGVGWRNQLFSRVGQPAQRQYLGVIGRTILLADLKNLRPEICEQPGR